MTSEISSDVARVLVLYASSHGKTRRVADRVAKGIERAATLACVTDLHNPQQLLDYNVIVVCCPNYGDGEVQADMEAFLQTLDLDLHEQSVAVCELGNYFGYEGFSFGAMSIIRQELVSRGASELICPLSLDSVPRMSESQLQKWIDHLRGALDDYRA